ncbi:hypothetical protein THRCLA_20489 [Thraustotheca clavata]|uniref:Uncharacterized protein n=1 Tax=Thraustotheca clavata TaxID=74557 RepID=A0A1W0A6N7_9STRA|nr:hypothetical protein THRCLA_20489 [Thraustotheca clavata]
MHCGLPFLLTSLPFDKSQAIKIGNKMFCRPSTLTILGCTSIAEEDAHNISGRGIKGVVPYNDKNAGQAYIVSVYVLGTLLYFHHLLPGFDHVRFALLLKTSLYQTKKMINWITTTVIDIQEPFTFY